MLIGPDVSTRSGLDNAGRHHGSEGRGELGCALNLPPKGGRWPLQMLLGRNQPLNIGGSHGRSGGCGGGDSSLGFDDVANGSVGSCRWH